MRFIVGRFTSFSTEIELLPKIFLYSMKIKVQTRKLAAGCSKHGFEVVDETDEVSSKHGFEVVDETDEVSSKHGFEVADRTDEVSSKHGFEVADRTDEVSNIYTAR
ncbi:chlorohydrolase [Streptococcus pneumoniae]|nr:chlorohydrolase [Streptococcus pneumoniae]CVV13667.1 chlorohydrolase [Streptococcus pneumoniae]CWC21987.1 chlorohydrolase [Streptococcus pneumoniae]SNJ37601.1 chlorohydrolase [Streptococcus pneumoniae]SNN46647.1 chlorohydrolase [Streptococcus pneumoniae]